MANLGLQGFVGIVPTVGGVNITGSDATSQFSNFDFQPGSIVEVNANPLPTGENDFAQFIGMTGLIKDITGADILAINAGNVFEDFIVVPDAFTFDLEVVDTPVFIETAFSTTGQLSAFGSFYDVYGNRTSGELNFSADFAGFTLAETVSLVQSDNEFVATWSLNALAELEATDVPEASLGFFTIGLLIIAMAAKLRQR